MSRTQQTCYLRRLLLPVLAGGGLLAGSLPALTAGAADAFPAGIELVTRDAHWQGGPYEAFIRQAQALHGRGTAATLTLRSAPASLTDRPTRAAASARKTAPSIDVSQLRLRSLPQRQAPAAPVGPARAPDTAAAAGRAAAPAAGQSRVQIAIGPQAARALLEDTQQHGPLLLALLSRLEYEALRSHPALAHPRRPIAVLLRDPPAALQLALARALLPGSPRLAVIASTDLEPLVTELRQAAEPQTLDIHYTPDAASLAGVLRQALQQADALLLLPEQLGNDAAAGLTLLHAAATVRRPVIAASEAGVRAGALAAAVPTAAQLAGQALRIAADPSWQTRSPPYPAIRIYAASQVSVHFNHNIAARLGLPAPDTAALAARLHGTYTPLPR